MNQSYKLKALRLKQLYRSNNSTIQIEDDDYIQQCLVQDGKIFQEENKQHMIVIDDSDMKEPTKGHDQKLINNFKPHIESDNEDKPRKSIGQKKSKALNNQQAKPVDKDYFQSISQRVTTHLDNEIQEPQELMPQSSTLPQQNNQEAFSISQYQFLKLKEAQENQLRKQKEIQQEKLDQQLINQEEEKKRKDGETYSQYIERMLRLLQKELNQNKRYKNGEQAVKKKQEQIDQQEKKEQKEKNDILDEDKFIQELLKTYKGDSLALSKEVQINLNDPLFLNYDVLVKTNKILRQAKIHYQSDSENEQQGQKKKAKDPYSIFRVWEHYGVSAEEYFASKDPYFAMRKSLLSRNSSELPKPKSEPKHFSFDVDRLISKRYSEQHQEIQYQAQFIGYPKKHWTPIKHLICKCPQLLINYETHERNRLYCSILNLKVHSVKQSTSFCMLSHKIVQGKKESPQVVYLKSLKQTQTEVKKSQNLKQKKKVTEIQEEEVEEDTARALRNKLRKEKMEQIQQEEQERLKEEQERKKQESQKKTKQNNKKSMAKSKLRNTQVKLRKVNHKQRKFKYSSNTSSNESDSSHLLSKEIDQFEIQHKKLKRISSDQFNQEIKQEESQVFSQNEINQRNRMFELD